MRSLKLQINDKKIKIFTNPGVVDLGNGEDLRGLHFCQHKEINQEKWVHFYIK
jgi:hypothetical protein